MENIHNDVRVLRVKSLGAKSQHFAMHSMRPGPLRR